MVKAGPGWVMAARDFELWGLGAKAREATEDAGSVEAAKEAREREGWVREEKDSKGAGREAAATGLRSAPVRSDESRVAAHAIAHQGTSKKLAPDPLDQTWQLTICVTNIDKF